MKQARIIAKTVRAGAGRLSHAARVLATGVIIAVLGLAWVPMRAAADCGTPGNQVHMYLFWDPTSSYTFPSSEGWALTTAYNGRFIRGEAPANFAQTGGDGSRPFTPSVTATVDPPNQTEVGGGSGTYASSTHTHSPPTFTVASDNNGDSSNPDVPAFRTLQLMEYAPSSGACIPTTIPKGAIALFNSTTMPVNFTLYNGENNKTIRIGSSVTTGGGDTVTNTVSNISGLGVDPNGGTDGAARFNFFNSGSATTLAATHTHGPPSPNYFTTTPTSSLPPYVQPVMGQAAADIPTLSLNLIALFDGDPGNIWTILSNPGGAYYQKFVRPSSTVDLSSDLGSTTHADPTQTVVSGTATPASSDKSFQLGSQTLATADHTHNINFNFGAVSNVPPYVNFVIAQKVSFVLNSFRWYVDPAGASTPAVTDPWPSGGLDINTDSILPAIPAPFRPPDDQYQTQLRLRLQIIVTGNPLVANATAFKLQYQATPNSDCLSGDWTDVGASGADWQYGTNNVADGTQLAASTFTPASTTLEVFSKSNSAGTPNGTNSGNSIEYDWLIQDTSAASGTEYHFRVIETNGTPFGSYYKLNTTSPECPAIVTQPGTEQQLRGGNFFLTNPDVANGQGSEQGFSWAD